MSTATFELHTPLAETGVETGVLGETRSKGFLQRATQDRQRQAEARIQAFLLGRSDAGLAKLGFAPGEIGAIRKTGRIPQSFWRQSFRR